MCKERGTFQEAYKTLSAMYKGGDIVRIFTSITVRRELFKQWPQLRKDLWGGEFWSDGYYLATVGERANYKIIECYVANQGKTMTIPPQLSLWLSSYTADTPSTCRRLVHCRRRAGSLPRYDTNICTFKISQSKRISPRPIRDLEVYGGIFSMHLNAIVCSLFSVYYKYEY